ncbi:unnamed protein product, partial [Allacma fusca]
MTDAVEIQSMELRPTHATCVAKISQLVTTVEHQRKEILRLHSVIHGMKIKERKTKSASKAAVVLPKLLSDAQRKILMGSKRVNWSIEDITSALSIRKNQSIGNFFEIINNGFDILNSRIPLDIKQRLKSRFGMCLDNQTLSLDKLKTLKETSKFRTTKGNSKTALLPCQIGFLISIKSLMGMYEELNRHFNITYVLSARLNQDCLENFFSRVRCFGGPNSNPTASEFSRN